MGFDFAAQRDNSAVPVHFRNIKHIKNPLLMPPIPIAIGTQKGELRVRQSQYEGERQRIISSSHHHIIAFLQLPPCGTSFAFTKSILVYLIFPITYYEMVLRLERFKNGKW